MAASSHGLRTWCVSDSDEETDFGCDRSPSPPPLILRETSSDGEGEEVEKDKGGNHGCLVIGRRPLLPGQTPWEPIWSEPGQTEGQAGRNSQEFKHRKRCSKVTPLERVKPCKGEGRRYAADKNRERRQNRGNMPSQHSNELSVRVAEVASQHPEYGGLQSVQRQDVWDSHHQEHPNTSSRVDLRRFDVRIATFAGREWRRNLPQPQQLARAGLYFTGMEDRVRCFSCGVELDEWGDEGPLTRHCQASPHCGFLRQDFPDQLESLRQSPTTQQAQYSNTSLRLHSFAHWPLSSIVTSYQLASVGFYYSGEGTKVKCFSCGLEVRDWKRGDVPLLVHCRANPECSFIKSIIKGAPPSERAPAPVLKTLAKDSANRPDYSDLQVRLQSFKKLSPAFPIPRMKLAESGLFLLRLPDVMKCHSCEAVLHGWVEGDVAVEKHRGASPNCPFLAERFPSKLSSPAPVDPSTLPAAEFDERELEMMARQQPTLTSYPSPHSQTTSLSVAGLSISDPHTSTSSPDSQPPSLSNPPQPISLLAALPSHHASSGYHSMTQPPSLTSNRSDTLSSLEKTLSSTTPSSTSYSTPYSTPYSSMASAASAASPSTGMVGGKAVSLPPSYSLGPPHSSMASDDNSKVITQQPASLPAGGECVVCMDKPLEMVFVPCGHICVCEECSSQISRCPICRTRTQMAVKVYFPY